MAYPRRLLGEGEVVVADLHPHWKALVGPAVLLVLVVGLASFGLAAMPAGRWHRPAQFAVLGAASLVAVAGCVRPYLRWRTTHYVLTNRRVVLRSGVLGRHGRDVPLHRVNDVTFAHSFLDRLLGCGALTIESGGERGQLAMVDVPQVETVQRRLHELIEADDARRRGHHEPGERSALVAAGRAPVALTRHPPAGRGVASPAAAAATAALLVGLFVVLRLGAHGWHLSSFVLAGDAFVDPDRAPAELVVERGTGYDGQFVYRLALGPTTNREVADGIRLDNPAYRAQRVGLPAMGWLVDRVPGVPLSLALILVNAVALVGVAYAGGRLASAYGRSPAWGLLVALSPVLLISLSRDLTEPLATLGLVAGMLLWTERRYALAVAAFCLGALTRETTLVVLAGMGLWQLLPGVRRTSVDRADRWRRALWLLVPLAAVLAWQAVLHGIWGRWPLLSSNGNLGLPLAGVARTILDTGADSAALDRPALLAGFWLVERVLLAFFLLYVAWSLPRSRLPAQMRLGWVLAAVLAVSASRWEQDVQFLRAASEAVTVGLLVLLARPAGQARPVLVGTAALAAAVAVVHSVAL